MPVRDYRDRYLPKGVKRPKTYLMKFLHKLFSLISEQLNLFATFDIVDLSNQGKEVALLKDNLEIGIVIQGPIIQRTTLEICKFYKQIYPQVRIVLSTWEDEDVALFDALCDEKFAVVQSSKPDIPGPSNINMQIRSTVAGINKLQDQKCNYILKTRTDILLGNPSFLNYLIRMQLKGKPQALVFSSFNSFLFRLFSPSDQVMFGKASDIARFWSIDLISDYEEKIFPEKYLFMKYLHSHGYETREDLSNYLTALRDYTVIADHEQLGQVWNKGAYTSLNYRWRGEHFPNQMTQITTWHWEMLQVELIYFEKLNSSLY
jgi:hypothetical protein